MDPHQILDYLVGGIPTPLEKMMDFVSWDDEISNRWKNKIHVPNHQSVVHIVISI